MKGCSSSIGLLFLPDTCNSKTSVRHGSTVAFQAYFKHDWLDCSTTTTSRGKSACASLYMEGNERNTCRESVFQIFRAHGYGDVRVGDLVGLYLTRESGKWLDCSQTACRKSSCAGIANYEHGFDTRKKWYSCYGSVFKIYAQGTLKNGMYSVVIKIETILYFMYHAIIHCLPSFIFYKSILSYGYLPWSC